MSQSPIPVRSGYSCFERRHKIGAKYYPHVVLNFCLIFLDRGQPGELRSGVGGKAKPFALPPRRSPHIAYSGLPSEPLISLAQVALTLSATFLGIAM
jgi:hypothetical protein